MHEKSIKQLNRVSISVSLGLGLGLVLGLVLGLMPSRDIVLKSTVLSSSRVPKTDWSGNGEGNRAGVTEIGLSESKKLCRSHSLFNTGQFCKFYITGAYTHEQDPNVDAQSPHGPVISTLTTDEKRCI